MTVGLPSPFRTSLDFSSCFEGQGKMSVILRKKRFKLDGSTFTMYAVVFCELLITL